MRIQKYLSEQGVCSRRTAEKLIATGKVLQGNKPVTLGDHITGQTLIVDGKTIRTKPEQQKKVLLLNKPRGILVSCAQEDDRPIIFNLRGLEEYLHVMKPVGRLDYHSEGLLLLSNDGELVHQLMHPSFEVSRTYIVRLNRMLTQADIEECARGIRLEDGMVHAKVEPYRKDRRLNSPNWYSVRLNEGRNRVVRRMFASIDCEVGRLRRIEYGGVQLPKELLPGDVIELSDGEIKTLRNAVLKTTPGTQETEASTIRKPSNISLSRNPFKPRAGDAPRRPFNRTEGDAPRRPFNRTEGDAPRRPFNRTEGDAPRRPFNRTEGDAPRRPFSRTEGDAPRRPFNRTEGDAPRRPFNRTEGDAPRRPFSRTEGDAPRRPFNRTEGDAPRRPFNRTEGDAPRRPFNRTEGDAPRRPFNRTEGDAPRRPFSRTEGDAPRRPFNRTEGDAPRRPFNKAEGKPAYRKSFK